MGRKVTIQDDADFVKTMIDRDLSNMPSDEMRLDYLKIVGDYVDEMGEQLMTMQRMHTRSDDTFDHRVDAANYIGENRPEREESDIDLGKSLDQILRQAIPGAMLLNLSDLVRGRPAATAMSYFFEGKCLIGAEAHAWLYERKHPTSYDHIHAYEDGSAICLPDADSTDPNMGTYLRPDGSAYHGHMKDVVRKAFEESKR